MMTAPRFCVVIPTFNNAQTLQQLVAGVQAVCTDVIVVNDGSTDATENLLDAISGIHKVSYQPNKGKGFALRKGFEAAAALGFEYAISIDSDGQHEPRNIADLVAVLQSATHPVLLMGARNMAQAGIPKKSSFGNQFSSFWFWAETGQKLSDTQTGFRAYPLQQVQKKHWFTNRFEFEIEVIVRLSWAGVAIQEVPVLVNYPPDRISHFRPFLDFARISILNTVLFTMAVFYFTPKRLLLGKGEKSLMRRLKREITQHHQNPVKLAAAIGVGMFFGIFPIWGFQMLAAFALTKWLKLNSVVALAVSNISIPPLTAIVIYGSFVFGKPFVAHGVAFPEFDQLTLASIGIHLYQYIIGAILLSVVAGVVAFAVAFLALQIFSKK